VITGLTFSSEFERTRWHVWTKRLLVALIGISILGCTGGVDSKLRRQVEDVLARKAKPLPRPAPPQTYVVYEYQGDGRDPFEPFYTPATKDIVRDDDTSPFRPVEGRIKEELEEFPLDSLRMVGTLEQEADVWGILINREGIVYRVQIGNYLGENFGKIIAILEDRVELEERARDSQGKWHLREASLALAE
jgi:type IV pilus assembly protein PilP